MTSPYVKAAAERAAAIKPHRTTELNPAGIYAPPGDPLHRPTPLLEMNESGFWRFNAPDQAEDHRLKSLVVRVIAYIGLAGVLTWALYLLSTSRVGQ